MTSALRRILPKSVANTGSQQRDHAANERTFLSWTRAGLGFAAMALALDRLDAIDRLLTSKLPGLVSASQGGNGNGNHHFTPSETSFQHHTADTNGHAKEGQRQATQSQSLLQQRSLSVSEFAQNMSATRVCQVLGLWCLGYGFFRYLSMRRYLMKGQFVPALWGPTFMAGGSLGAFFSLGMQMDRRRHS